MSASAALRLLPLSCLIVAAHCCSCQEIPSTPPAPDSSLRPPPATARPPALPARQPGPPLAERPAVLAAARAEAAQLATTLSQAGVATREVASVCDIRGYRLYRRRRFGQALVWFEQALRLDPSFEPALYNAARTASLLGQTAKARTQLQRLEQLATPLARGYLERSRSDPDLKR